MTIPIMMASAGITLIVVGVVLAVYERIANGKELFTHHAYERIEGGEFRIFTPSTGLVILAFGCFLLVASAVAQGLIPK
jgi:hypothetical protein